MSKIYFISILLVVFLSSFSLAQPNKAPLVNDDVAIQLAPEESNSPSFETLLNDLNARSFKAKTAAIVQLTSKDDERVLPILKAMQEGRLHYRKSDKKILLVNAVEEGNATTDPLTGAELGLLGSRESKKVRINNKLRGELAKQIAILQISASDVALRKEAALNLLKDPNESLREVIEQAKLKEQDKHIRYLLDLSVARLDIKSNDVNVRIGAVNVLGASVEPQTIQDLRKLVAKDELGHYIDTDKAVVLLAEEKIEWIESKLTYYKFTENLIFGMSLGSVLLLAAIGLAITFGVMGVINMAHGEMIMLGAYTTFAVQQIFPSSIEYSLIIAIPMAFLVSGSVGVIIERTVIRHLYGRPLDTLLATFGISLLLQQLVRVYNSNNVPVETPTWMAGSWVVNGALSFTYNRIYIFVFAIVVLVLLVLLLKKTLLGLQMRAVTQNRAMANSMGIRSGHVDALTFGLGSGIAGIAGVAISQITNVGPNLGQSFIIDSFMVVVFGGVGNLFGTFFAAIGLGVVTKFLEPQVGAVVGKILVLIFIILFIQWRPRGLFALKGRFVED